MPKAPPFHFELARWGQGFLGVFVARINIEDSLFSDERFVFVSSKIGRFEAAGQFLYITKLAQKYWKEGMKLIPFEIFEMGGFSEFFLKASLIEKRDSGFYLKGSEDNFAWLISKVQNGKKGGRPLKNNDLIKPTDNLQEPTDNLQEPTNNPLTLTHSLSLSHTNLIKKEQSLISSSVVINKGKINHAEIVDIFNLELGGKGRVKRFCSHSFSPEMINNFNILIGYQEFSTKEGLIEYFKTIAKSVYLTDTAPISLTWVLNPNNALKVVSGQFQDFKKKQTKSERVIDSAIQNMKQNPFRKESKNEQREDL